MKIPWLAVAIGIGFLGILIALVAVLTHNGSSNVATSSPGVSVSTPSGGQPSGGQSSGGAASSSSGGAASGSAASSGPPTLPDSSPGLISKAFSFTLNGTPPAGDSFVLVFDHGTVETVTLCGGSGAPDCTGNGEQLGQAFANLQPHSGGAYRFERHAPSGQVNVFFSGTDPMSNSSTITAYFNEQ